MRSKFAILIPPKERSPYVLLMGLKSSAIKSKMLGGGKFEVGLFVGLGVLGFWVGCAVGLALMGFPVGLAVAMLGCAVGVYVGNEVGEV